MALALPILPQALWLHRLEAPVHTVLPLHGGPEHVEAALAGSELLPLGARRIQQQPTSLGVNIAERHRPHFWPSLGGHGRQEAHVHMGIVTLSGFLTRLDDVRDWVHGHSLLASSPIPRFSPRYDLRTTSLRSVS